MFLLLMLLYLLESFEWEPGPLPDGWRPDIGVDPPQSGEHDAKSKDPNVMFHHLNGVGRRGVDGGVGCEEPQVYLVQGLTRNKRPVDERFLYGPR